MWWSDDIVPRWVERGLAAAFVTVVGFFVALVAWMGLVWVSDWVFYASLWHPTWTYTIAVGCGLALALVNDWFFFVRAR